MIELPQTASVGAPATNRIYRKPTLVVHGTVRELTAGGSSGAKEGVGEGGVQNKNPRA